MIFQIIDVTQKRLCKEKGDAVTALRTVLQGWYFIKMAN